MRPGRLARIALRAGFASLVGDRERAVRHGRRLLFMLLEDQLEEMSFRRGGTRWTVPARDDPIARNLFVRGEHQGPELEALLAWLGARGYLGPERGALVDVGANIGSPSIPIALETGLRPLAIEPMPRNFALLERNVRDNGLAERFFCLNAAISTSAGELHMVGSEQGGGCEVETEAGSQGFGELAPGQTRLRVPALTLDDALAKHGIDPAEVAFAWSDTQGHERQVIASGTSLWRAGAPLFVELWPRGLRAHGGLEPFLATASDCFEALVPRRDLLEAGARAEPLPIAELGPLLDSLGDRHTDGLLIPHAAP